MWIPYNEAIAKNMTDYPKVGDMILYRAKKGRKGKEPICYNGTITRVISQRRYMVKYKVSDDVKYSFINGTSSAIVKIEDLFYFNNTVIYKNEESTPDNSQG